MIGPGDATEVVPFFTTAATIVAVQKLLKNTSQYRRFVVAFPGADKWAHWTFAVIASFIGAGYIHVTWNWTAIAGGQVLFGLPSVVTLWHASGDFFKVFIMQLTVYQSTHQPPYDSMHKIHEYSEMLAEFKQRKQKEGLTRD